MVSYRILVTGSREFTDYLVIYNAIFRAIAEGAHWTDPVTLVSGHARGADLLAEKAAEAFSVDEIERHPAKWTLFGKAAGAIRNTEMVASGADICLAFYQEGALNRGTRDCVEKARAAGIPVREHTSGPAAPRDAR